MRHPYITTREQTPLTATRESSHSNEEPVQTKKRTMNKMEFQKIFNTKKDKKRTEEQRTERQTKRQMAKSKIQYW